MFRGQQDLGHALDKRLPTWTVLWVSLSPGTLEVCLPLRMPTRKRTWPSLCPVMPPQGGPQQAPHCLPSLSSPMKKERMRWEKQMFGCLDSLSN